MTLSSPARDIEPSSRRQLIGQGLLFAALVATLLLAISPTPFVVERPGPVFDTLGTTTIDGEDVPVITIDGAESYPTEGSLDLLTVYLDGSREHPIGWVDVIAAWFDRTKTVLPVDAVFPEGQTLEEAEEESALDMTTSQDAAIAAALTELDIPFATTVVVVAVGEGTPADGVLEPGDEILAVGGEPIDGDAALRSAIRDAGAGNPVAVEIRRDDALQTVEVTPVARSASDDTPVVGIEPGETHDFPFEVEIRLDDVGGPSAGMMFALAIYDTLTPGALTGGEHIAGTGTVSSDGTVGAIGGVRQKMFAAVDAGADWFLVPTANCDGLDGIVPDGLEVFAIESLDDAIAVVEAAGTGADTTGFARCPA